LFKACINKHVTTALRLIQCGADTAAQDAVWLSTRDEYFDYECIQAGKTALEYLSEIEDKQLLQAAVDTLYLFK
jgi:hypothetical protein